jgi:ubiquinone/menaquinone biosynthesis C-methylase UbiE
MPHQDTSGVRKAYDRVADEYVGRIYDELQHKPFDRDLRDRFADRLQGKGTVCDLGCGPGQVSRYLRDHGTEVIGLDLSPEMVARAAALNPDIQFRTGNMLGLDVADKSWAGIVAFYSIVNLSINDLPQAAREMYRVLSPGGWLLLNFHIGDETLHLDEWWDRSVNIDFHFFQSAAVTDVLRSAGFEVVEVHERQPYPDVEHQSRRAYINAQRPVS